MSLSDEVAKKSLCVMMTALQGPRDVVIHRAALALFTLKPFLLSTKYHQLSLTTTKLEVLLAPIC